jgi:hypothetical protein
VRISAGASWKCRSVEVKRQKRGRAKARHEMARHRLIRGRSAARFVQGSFQGAATPAACALRRQRPAFAGHRQRRSAERCWHRDEMCGRSELVRNVKLSSAPACRLGLAAGAAREQARLRPLRCRPPRGARAGAEQHLAAAAAAARGSAELRASAHVVPPPPSAPAGRKGAAGAVSHGDAQRCRHAAAAHTTFRAAHALRMANGAAWRMVLRGCRRGGARMLDLQGCCRKSEAARPLCQRRHRDAARPHAAIPRTLD